MAACKSSAATKRPHRSRRTIRLMQMHLHQCWAGRRAHYARGFKVYIDSASHRMPHDCNYPFFLCAHFLSLCSIAFAVGWQMVGHYATRWPTSARRSVRRRRPRSSSATPTFSRRAWAFCMASSSWRICRGPYELSLIVYPLSGRRARSRPSKGSWRTSSPHDPCLQKLELTSSMRVSSLWSISQHLCSGITTALRWLGS